MWRSAQYAKTETNNGDDVDDWDTDPDFVNDVSEEDSRWGSKTISGSGRTAAAINLDQLRSEVNQEDSQVREKFAHASQKDHSAGFGGKFGVQSERVDKSAVGFDYHEKLAAHASQKDHSTGFGGKFGIQSDRVDRSAVGWDHHEKVDKHESQKDYSVGFGGKFGVQRDRVDQSAVGWEHRESVEKHSSQVDASKGFGGKFGIEQDRKDKSALGWEHHEKVDKHESQKDYSVGFGGKFGIQKDRKDKSAVGWEHHEKVDKHESQKDYSVGFGGKYGVMKDRVDKSAVGWEHHESVEKHSSQVDASKGFGGKFGVQRDRVDRSAHNWQETEDDEDKKSPAPTKTKIDVKGDAKSLRARFENFAKQDETESQKKLESERQKRLDREKLEKEAARKAEEDRQAKLKEDESLEMGQNAEDNAKNSTSSEDEDESPVKSPHFNRIGVSVFPVLEKSPSPPKVPLSPEPAATTASIPVAFSAEPVVKEEPAPSTGLAFKVEASEEDVEDVDAWSEEPVLAGSASAAPTMLATASASANQGLTAIALYDYEAAEADEISFDPDEIITHIEKIDEGWWRGQCRQKTGLFPSNYVKLLDE